MSSQCKYLLLGLELSHSHSEIEFLRLEFSDSNSCTDTLGPDFQTRALGLKLVDSGFAVGLSNSDFPIRTLRLGLSDSDSDSQTLRIALSKLQFRTETLKLGLANSESRPRSF